MGNIDRLNRILTIKFRFVVIYLWNRIIQIIIVHLREFAYFFVYR